MSTAEASLNKEMDGLRPKEGLWKKRPELILSPIVLVALVGFIEFVLIPVLKIPDWIFPKPSVIVATLIQDFNKVIFKELLTTLNELFTGYFIGAPLGIVLAAVITQFGLVEKIVSPYILTLVVTPMVALVPLLMLIFGFGATTKIVVVIIASFPPIMMNSIVGFRSTDELRLDLMKSLNASPLTTFLTVRLPNALPTIFTGLVLGLIGSLTSVVAAEFLGGTQGLGYLIVYAASILQTKLMYATILLLALMGIVIYSIIMALQKLIVRW
jgi:NitT/TauT family transport system permease protein